MPDEYDSLDPKTPGLDRQEGELEGAWTTTPEQMYEGLKELHGEKWLKEQGIEKPRARGLKTGGLETGGLVTGRVGDTKKPGNSATGGAGVAVVVDDVAPNIRLLVEEKVESLFLKAKPLKQFVPFRFDGEPDELKVYEGCVFIPKGTKADDDAVAVKLIIPTSMVEIEGTGSIWLALNVSFVQLSTSQTTDSNPITLRVWRIANATSAGYTWRGSAPNPTYSNTDEWTDAVTVRLYWEIAEVQLVNGVAGVTRQLQEGPIMVPNFTDAFINS
tara:strand:- start:17690 stop:18508 length:819 start_codon:yes stop_codon:yes gene_type:complete